MRPKRGLGTEEPLVYEGSGTTDRRWLVADERGSVIGIADAGAVTKVNKYDVYGVPDATNQGRFQYTGQMWMSELNLYHYKARAYHPRLGRFMQTDPIGVAGGINLYGYVGNDPVNGTDSTGLSEDEIETVTVEGCRICLEDPVELPRRRDGGGGGGGDGGGGGGTVPAADPGVTPEQGNKVTLTCGISTSTEGVRGLLPDKGAFQQIRDGLTSYAKGVLDGSIAIAVRLGAAGPEAQQRAAAVNGLIIDSTILAAKNPGLTFTLGYGFATKYPLQVAARAGLGTALSFGATPYVGIPTTFLAIYGNAFQASAQNVEGLVRALTLGEACNQNFDGQP